MFAYRFRDVNGRLSFCHVLHLLPVLLAYQDTQGCGYMAYVSNLIDYVSSYMLFSHALRALVVNVSHRVHVMAVAPSQPTLVA